MENAEACVAHADRFADVEQRDGRFLVGTLSAKHFATVPAVVPALCVRLRDESTNEHKMQTGRLNHILE